MFISNYLLLMFPSPQLLLFALSIYFSQVKCDDAVFSEINDNNKNNNLKPLNANDLLNQILSSSSSTDQNNVVDANNKNNILDVNRRANVVEDVNNNPSLNLVDNGDKNSGGIGVGVGGSDVPSKQAPHRHHNKGETHYQPNRDPELIVNTANGLIQGRAYYLDHHLPKTPNQSSRSFPYGKKKYRVNAWLGIPFGEKPLGDLRFKRPIPVKNWNGTLNATMLPNSCYQLIDTVITEFDGVDMWNPNTNISEDCLYLNIWTPHPKPRNAAVMVWIYGGGFIAGTSTLKVYDPRIIVSETQVIFVSIQYRLSIFGFLYMDNEQAPGNQGLLDQYLAMKWIHNNIQYFGGDSAKITIFGESAGSVSVSLHLLSPLSSNLFRNAIMESGTALADWALLNYEDAIERNSGILGHMGCNVTANVTEAIECARHVDPKTAIEKADEYFYSKAIHGVAQFTFLPVVDRYFLEEEPIKLLNRGKFKKCPILLGGNKDEGNWLFVYSFPEYRNLTVRPGIDYEMFKDFVTSLYYFYPQFPAVSSKAVLDAILYRYTNWQNVNNDMRNFENLDDAAGDFHFVCPTLDFANTYALKGQDVFFYYYTQRSSRHFWPEWLGVMHGDEISFVFGEPLYPELNFTYEEKVLARKMLKYWSNFAKYSNPNGPPDEKSDEQQQQQQSKTITNSGSKSISVSSVNQRKFDKTDSTTITQTQLQMAEHWPKYTINMHPHNYNDEQRAYLTLNSDKVEVGYNLRSEYCAFWGTFLPTIMLSENRCKCGTCSVAKMQKSSGSSHFSALLKLDSSPFVLVFIILAKTIN